MSNENEDCGKVIWITGLSGAGKTTLAKEIHKNMPGSLFIDGDMMRDIVNRTNKDFDAKSRKETSMIYSKLAKLVSSQGIDIIIAAICLHHHVHAWNRQNLKKYIEIFLDVPLDVLRKRDPKGYYLNYDLGLMKNISGLDIPVEYPLDPNIRFTHEISINEEVETVLKYIDINFNNKHFNK